MPARAPRPVALPVDYVARTRALPVNLLFLMPWVFLYQISLYFSQSPVDNAAAAWFRKVFTAMGRQGFLLTTLGVALGLAVFLFVRYRKEARDHGVFGGMLLEGLFYGTLLGTAASLMASSLPMGRMIPLAAPAGDALHEMRAGIQDLGLAVGAGIFEELLFRGILLFGLHALLRHWIGADRITAGTVAILASAYVFSDYHHWGVTGEPYDARVFAFRFHAGILLGAVYVFRGLGIAAFAHGFYDVLAMVGR